MSSSILYPYSLFFTIMAASVTILYYGLKFAETKNKVHISSYSMRKLFIDEFKRVSNETNDIFENRLTKNRKKDFFVTILIGLAIFAFILSVDLFEPVNLGSYGSTNYYFIVYWTDLFPVFSLLYIPLKLDSILIRLEERSAEHFINIREGKVEDTPFDEDNSERRQIRLYHYIKYFRYVSEITTFGLIIQILIIVSTPYFYYNTNIFIGSFPFIILGYIVIVIILMGRIRINLTYDFESNFFKIMAPLPFTNKSLLLKTADNELFSGEPKLCYLEGLGSKLIISYEWENKWFVSYVRWKNVSSFGLYFPILNENLKREQKHNATESDSNS